MRVVAVDGTRAPAWRILVRTAVKLLPWEVAHFMVWNTVAAAGDLLILLGYFIIFLVFRINSFTSATIAIHEDQKVISTGLYAWVRHPMYAGGLLFLLGVPLALGSYRGLLVFIPLIPILIWRLLDEEKFLAENLPGYAEYRTQMKYRLLPFLW